MNENSKRSSLTAKQELFALCVAEGHPSADAYRIAYVATGMAAPTVWSEASRLANHPKVSARIDQIKAEKDQVRRILVLDQEESILAQLQHEALTAKSDSARIRALELLGRHVGMFVERVEVTRPERTLEQIHSEIVVRLRKFALDGV